jgi:hypothetical protein
MNANNSSTVTSYLRGTAFLPQVLLAIVIASIVYITLISCELLYKSLYAVAKTRTALLPYTYTTEKQLEIKQDPNDPNALTTVLSDNEHTGIEFSYSCFLHINENSFVDQQGFLHIFHKGYNLPFPLLGPGVFLHGNINCIRVYMNATNTWNKYVDVENIPLKKWFHLAIVCRKNAVEVYLNGNLSKKLNFEGSIPYQNFGNYYVFSQRKLSLTKARVPSVDEEGFNILGRIDGMISRLDYFSYALSFTEINAILNQGPSTYIVSATQNKPPYLADTYWTTQYTSSM